MYDVIVVGAGPGGAMAAYHAARAGLKTLLLEKERMPRYKPCGGGVTARVKHILDFDFSRTVEDTITDASVAFGPERVRAHYAEPIVWMVMRDKFDCALAQIAAQAGAEVREGQPVSQVAFDDKGVDVSTPHEKLRGRFIVGADGMNGVVRRAAGFGPHATVAAALEAEMDAPSAALEEWQGALHVDFGAIAKGYAWIFPKAEHLSVGIGAFLNGNRKVNLRAELERYIQSEPSLRKARTRFTRGHRIPMGERMPAYHGARVLLVGDAAGLVDPFSGIGIYYAMRSGQIAADEIARASGQGDGSLVRYSQRIQAEMVSDFRTAWLLAQLVYRFPRLSFRVFRGSRAARNTAPQILAGTNTYAQVLAEFFKSGMSSVLKKSWKIIPSSPA